uniref:G-protein coupled receptors family 1 profile domain-containing protein n=1 Tax=Cairina moschata TaxID=8855 RepID=A0A8C3CW19_CAIMO
PSTQPWSSSLPVVFIPNRSLHPYRSSSTQPLSSSPFVASSSLPIVFIPNRRLHPHPLSSSPTVIFIPIHRLHPNPLSSSPTIVFIPTGCLHPHPLSSSPTVVFIPPHRLHPNVVFIPPHRPHPNHRLHPRPQPSSPALPPFLAPPAPRHAPGGAGRAPGGLLHPHGAGRAQPDGAQPLPGAADPPGQPGGVPGDVGLHVRADRAGGAHQQPDHLLHRQVQEAALAPQLHPGQPGRLQPAGHLRRLHHRLLQLLPDVFRPGAHRLQDRGLRRHPGRHGEPVVAGGGGLRALPGDLQAPGQLHLPGQPRGAGLRGHLGAGAGGLGAAALRLEQQEQSASTQKAEREVTKMVVVMVLGFLLCWAPYTAFALWVVTHRGRSFEVGLASVPSVFSKSSTVYNPVIYVLMNKQFRSCMLKLVFCGRSPFGDEDDVSGSSQATQVSSVSSSQVSPA